MISETLILEGLALESSIIPKSGSDHWPMQFWIDTTSAPKFKPFKFEKFWINHPDFHELSHKWCSEETGTHGTKMFRFQQNLKHFKHSM
jgi:hypothetical protein